MLVLFLCLVTQDINAYEMNKKYLSIEVKRLKDLNIGVIKLTGMIINNNSAINIVVGWLMRVRSQRNESKAHEIGIAFT